MPRRRSAPSTSSQVCPAATTPRTSAWPRPTTWFSRLRRAYSRARRSRCYHPALELAERGVQQPGGGRVRPGARRDPRGRPVRGQVDRGRSVRDRGDDLQPHPQPRCPGQLDRVPAEIEHVLAVRRVQVRDGHVGQRAVRRAGQGRGLGGGVVADQDQRAAPWVGAHQVPVPQRVGGPVQAGRLAVPDAEHPVAGGAGERAGELAALDRGGGRFLVQSRDERDIVRVEQLLQPAELLVVAGQRGPLVPGDERPDVQAGGQVAPVLVDGQPGQGLDPGQLHPSRGSGVPVTQLRAGRRFGHLVLRVKPSGAAY